MPTHTYYMNSVVAAHEAIDSLNANNHKIEKFCYTSSKQLYGKRRN